METIKNTLTLNYNQESFVPCRDGGSKKEKWRRIHHQALDQKNEKKENINDVFDIFHLFRVKYDFYNFIISRIHKLTS